MGEVRIPYKTIKAEFERILIKNGFTSDRAGRCAEIFAANSLEGVYSHGINRFPRFIEYIQKGYVDVNGNPEIIHTAGALEQWNGNLGPGPLNAEFCTKRAMELAEQNGIGCVAIASTNHWMRAGRYGWQAAKKGFVLIAWTNTMPNTPAWGATNVKLGNNPMVFAVPFNNEAIVLDFAMTQFSYGKMEAAKMNGEMLPYPGGFNNKGELTNDPSEILDTWQALTIGYWKGAGLSLMLDILATILSAGMSTSDIGRLESEYGVSQVFVAIQLSRLKNFPSISNTIAGIIDDFKKSVPSDPQNTIRYPGERVLLVREENLKSGIPVNKNVWEEICNL
ncbi:MAG: 3-dehydro-L-gulonate 2-dehydrogenase [Prolixibacteraceae bacterium]|nr:3-dehydro-L-gulonate 2-dehydrogenase [Prolixibacteraceae bacterium]